MKTNSIGSAWTRYHFELAVSMIAYAALLVTSLHLIKTQTFDQVSLTIIAVIPAVPLFFVMASVIRLINSIDELQRRVTLESLAFAAGATALISVTWGFLENAGLPPPPPFWAFVSVNIFWVLARPFISRRYR